jgi:hypothetical protein
MAKYVVMPGYCLHLPRNVFIHPGEEVELSGDLEKEVLDKQSWKVERVPEPATEATEAKEIPEPPKDRAVKEARTK